MALEKGLDFQGFFSVVPASAGVILAALPADGLLGGSPRICGGDPLSGGFHPLVNA